jgi:hypothetical protein
MIYALVDRPDITKIVKVDESNWNEFSRNMWTRGYKVSKVPKPPAPRTLRRWKLLNKGRTINGIWTEGFQSDELHGWSWLSIFHKINSKKRLTNRR